MGYPLSELGRIESLVRAGMVQEAASHLSRAAGKSPSLTWVRTTVGAISSLPLTADPRPGLQGAALLQLIRSGALRTSLSKLRRDEARLVRDRLMSPTPPRLAATQQSWSGVGRSFTEGDPREVLAGLSAIRRAGGIAYAVLAAERGAALLRPGDFEQAFAVLQGIEREAAVHITGQRELPRERRRAAVGEVSLTPEAMAELRARRESGGPSRLDDLHAAQTLVDFVLTHPVVTRAIERGRPPSLLTHLLTEVDSERQAAGFCHPLVTLIGHLGLLVGIPFDILLHTRHINLFHRPTQLVVEPSHVPVFWSTLPMWRDLGTFGHRQHPVGLEALVAGTLLNIESLWVRRSEERAARFVEAALGVYPDYAAALVTRALRGRDREESERLVRRAIQLHRQYTKAYEVLGDIEASRNHSAAAARSYEQALQSARQSRGAADRLLTVQRHVPTDHDLLRIMMSLGHALEQAGVRRPRRPVRRSGKGSRVIRLFEQVAREATAPDLRAKAHFYIAWLLWGAGRRRGAFRHWARALALDPTVEAELHHLISQLARRRERLREAIEIARHFSPEHLGRTGT